MTLKQIEYVIKIADFASMNKAAEALFVSQPTLTGAVKELEAELGISIFKRTSGGTVLTTDGEEFIAYARQLFQQYELLNGRYKDPGSVKLKFGVSSQHYSFAVKAFVETVKQFDMKKYEFAMREGKTSDVIDDVKKFKSEIGILYLNDFNREVISKILRDNNLEFKHLIHCNAYVYLWKKHPLASKKCITFEELLDYPCLSFEQGEKGSLYFSEEILSTEEYTKTIKTADRSSMLNLMVGLNGYTLCSGIICEELNGSDFVAIPFEADGKDTVMDIGYITRRGSNLSEIGSVYIKEIEEYLKRCS